MKIKKNEHILLFFNLIFYVISIYKFPFFKDVILLIPLIYFYKSKKNYFWFALFLILIEQPGGLFFGGTRQDIYRLPLYSLGKGVSISYQQIFLFIALSKAIKIKKKYTPFFGKNLRRLGFYFIFLASISFVLGMNFSGIKSIYKIFIHLTLYYSIYFLFRDESEWIKFFKIIFPYSFVSLGLQIYSLMAGHQLVHIFNPEITLTQGVLGLKSSKFWNRPIEMIHLTYICFIASLAFIISGKKAFKKTYLWLINITSFISIFFTATRSWIIAVLFIYLLVLVIIPQKRIKNIFRYTTAVLIVLLISIISPIVKNQLSSSFDRFKTSEYLLKGDITAGGTLKRFDVRAPKILKAYKESTVIFGAAFSNLYWEKADAHVGYLNYLFNTGIVGAILLFLFIINYFSNILFFIRSKQLIEEKLRLKIIGLGMIGILLINVGTQFFGYDVILNRVFIIAIILFWSNTIFQKIYEKKMEVWSYESYNFMRRYGYALKGRNRV